jgi:PHD/YefM family antitoxin component YafN of YafNO toxin-antitoxin module
MYKMASLPGRRLRRWSVAEARAKLPDVFAAAAHEPQAIFRHGEPAAIVLAPREFLALDARRIEPETLADAFATLRRLAGGSLALPRRRGAVGFARRR